MNVEIEHTFKFHGRRLLRAVLALGFALALGTLTLLDDATPVIAEEVKTNSLSEVKNLVLPTTKPSRTSVCRDSRGRFASCGSASDWFDFVPSLRVPSISINLGRIIPSVSLGSPIKWGFKVPFSYTPRVKFMKFQVYFNPDFDYFNSKATWLTLATLKAVGNTAQVKSEQRAGTHKYRVYAPEGGGFESWTSRTSKTKVKGVATKGTLFIDPSETYEDENITLKVVLENKKTVRDVYFLTSSICPSGSPWKNGVGPATGWDVVGAGFLSSTISTTKPWLMPATKTGGSTWAVTPATDWHGGVIDKGVLVKGTTTGGEFSWTFRSAVSDNKRCYAAFVPGKGSLRPWTSNVVTSMVKPKTSSVLSASSSSLSIASGETISLNGTITAATSRPIDIGVCDSSTLGKLTSVTSDERGNFSFSHTLDLPAGTYNLCLSSPSTLTIKSAELKIPLVVRQATLSGSVAISTTSINTGQQFTVSGSITPYVANKQVWIRVQCETSYGWERDGWGSRFTVAYPAHSTTGNPTGSKGLDYFANSADYYSSTYLTVDSSGNFTKTFTSNTPQTCIYGAYIPATDYHTAWLSDPTNAITVN